MRKFVGCLIGTILCLTSLAQNKEICIPDQALTRMISELLEKDHLVYVVNLQDSLLKVYEHKAVIDSTLIYTLKLTVEDYRIIVESLEEKNKLQKDAYEQALKKEKVGRLLSFFKGVGVALLAFFVYQSVK